MKRILKPALATTCYALLLSVSFVLRVALAQEIPEKRALYAAQTLEMSGEVSSAYMLFSSEVGVNGLVPATVLRMANRKNIVIVASYQGDDSPGAVIVTGVAVGKDGTIVSRTSQLEEQGLEGVSTMNARELVGRLDAAKASLANLENERGNQAQNLERLQQDADTIANIGRIVDAEDELGAVKSDEERLSASLAAAKSQLLVLKSQTPPTNYQRREAELSAFLTDFARASRDSNSEVFKKLAAVEDEAAKNLALIEESKFEHVDLLQKELNSLRKEREAVERSRQVVVADRPVETQRERPAELRREVPIPEPSEEGEGESVDEDSTGDEATGEDSGTSGE